MAGCARGYATARCARVAAASSASARQRALSALATAVARNAQPSPRLPRLDASAALGHAARRTLATSAADPYKLLGVGRTASQAEIKKAYFQLAKRYHPDVNSSPEASRKFREVSGAYEVLKDPGSRAEYDRGGGPWADASDGHSQTRSSGRSYEQQGQQQTRHQREYEDRFRTVWAERGP